MQNLIEVKNGIPAANSKDIAEHFKKTHRHVLEAIRSMDCSPEFRESNFRLSSYRSPQNKILPCYDITMSGFCFLGMGFTGKEAATWKEKYIAAFNSAILYVEKENKDLSLIESLNIASKKIDDIQAAGSAWGKNGTLIRKHKKAAIENLCDLMDKAQLKLGFSK